MKKFLPLASSIVLVIIFGLYILLFLKRPPQNNYTKIAAIELVVSLVISAVAIMICGVFTECPSTMYDDFYVIPFYISVKI